MQEHALSSTSKDKAMQVVHFDIHFLLLDTVGKKLDHKLHSFYILVDEITASSSEFWLTFITVKFELSMEYFYM